MVNRIKQVEKIEKEARMGWPNGSIEAYKTIPTLLARIRELEAVLMPFAKVGIAEQQYSTPDKLVNIKQADCLRAKDILDPAKSVQLPVEDFGLPAEA